MKVEKTTTVEELVVNYPQTVKVFMRFGIPCISCGSPLWGTVEEEAKRKGVSGEKLDELIAELQRVVDGGGG